MAAIFDMEVRETVLEKQVQGGVNDALTTVFTFLSHVTWRVALNRDKVARMGACDKLYCGGLR